MFGFRLIRDIGEPYMYGDLDWVKTTLIIIGNVLRFLGIIIAAIYILDGLYDTVVYFKYNQSHSADISLTVPQALKKFLIPNFAQAMIYLIITGLIGIALKVCNYLYIYLTFRANENVTKRIF